jgi:threonylcarbamoyladenosine tRNA methylthiotransferase MtaB
MQKTGRRLSANSLNVSKTKISFLVVLPMKFAFYTLGCKVNQYETQAMEQLLTARGHTLGQFDELCDVYVVNTCTVTAVSDKKSRAMLRRARRLNPDAVVGVCGCYAQTAPDELRKLGVDVMVGTSGREEFVGRLVEAAQSKKTWEQVDNAAQPRPFEQLPAGGLAERTRALLKIEDGCDNFCSYCIIPYARGRVRSLPLEAAVEDARKLAAEGYREIVVNGIEISSWGKEWKNGARLDGLLAALCRAVPDTRIRLGSLEPRTIDEEFCRALSGFPNLCPQFHLSLQSGSDAVLARMRRKYDTARYFESVRLLRAAFPGCAVTTDLIVGFPGETEEEFAQSLEFLRRCELSAFHIFPYSRRKGTPAAAMDGQIPNAVKEQRAARAAETAGELSRAWLERQLGTRQQVLFEQPEDGYFAGHAPNYTKVYVRGDGLHNEIRAVEIRSLFRDGLLGELV